MQGCIFCQVVAGDAPNSLVYEDDRLIAFMDIPPVNTGHTLVIPKVHVERIANLEQGIGSHLFAR